MVQVTRPVPGSAPVTFPWVALTRAGLARQGCPSRLDALRGGGPAGWCLFEQQQPCYVDAGEYQDGQQRGLDAHGCSADPEAADDAGRDREQPDEGVKDNREY